MEVAGGVGGDTCSQLRHLHGYELIEHVPRPGAEEQIDDEKYQYKDRGWPDYEPGGPRARQSIAPWLTMLNDIRRSNPALHWLRNLRFHRSDNEQILVFSKRRRMFDQGNVILVVVNVDPHATQAGMVHLDVPALGLHWNDSFVAHELVAGQRWNWQEDNFVRLGLGAEPVQILRVEAS